MSDPRPFRLGFFSYLQGNGSPQQVYDEAMALFIAADRFGFDKAWVAQHSFDHHGGLPSPFVFFSALGARTEQIGFGTAIISLPLQNPVRVAEDAAVLEAYYPGRLDLGTGTGFASPAVLATFDHPGGDRRALYDDKIVRLIDALEGKPVNDDGDVLFPPAPALRQRLWEAPSTEERVAESARRGTGLLLSRIAIGTSTRTEVVQRGLVDRYKAELPDGVAPRIGLSRTVFPSRHPDAVYRSISDGLREMAKVRAAQQGGKPADRPMEELFAEHNIHWGTPDQVVASLRREPLLDEVTDLICQVQPGLPSFEQTLEAIELIATEVAPALGWSPARQAAAV
jgi:alkanesulfonate monooxygenase SsuD/methylene tetrahydromethanopterin reductase-like flavin-dependent oxidoreductase (luciferase family)